METLYSVAGWEIAAWFSVTILLATASYFLGSWVGWRSKPVNFYTIARCELSSKTNYTKVPGCPLGREGVPHTPLICGSSTSVGASNLAKETVAKEG
jgi:hypothetical protein